MRSNLIASGVSAAAAVLLMTACGGGSDDDSASSTTSPASSSAAETSSAAPQADSEFCTKAADFGSSINSSFDSNDPAQLTKGLQDAADGVRAIEPPAEIADDWNALADGLEKVSKTLDGADINDPKVAAQVQTDIQSLAEPSTNVQTYLQEQCGIDTEGTASPSDSAAPSS
jgi:hypothetical protein